MGLFRFVKDAGSILFDRTGFKDQFKPVEEQLRDAGIDPSTLDLSWEGTRVTVTGTQPNQESKEKAVLVLGNIRDVDEVVDQIVVARAESPTEAPAQAAPAAEDAPRTSATPGGEATPEDWESDTYTVKSGDTLSGIAKSVYGDASKYMKIFEANKPMLSDPNKIYPGQVLRIPAA